MVALYIDKLIGRNLKRLREEHSLSQVKLAEMIKTTPQRLSSYENGRDGMGKDFMSRVCKALKVEPWEFFMTKNVPIITDISEKRALDLWRKATILGVADEVAIYASYRIKQAKKEIR